MSAKKTTLQLQREFRPGWESPEPPPQSIFGANTTARSAATTNWRRRISTVLLIGLMALILSSYSLDLTSKGLHSDVELSLPPLVEEVEPNSSPASEADKASHSLVSTIAAAELTMPSPKAIEEVRVVTAAPRAPRSQQDAAELVNRMSRLANLRSNGPEGGSRFAGILYEVTNGRMKKLKVIKPVGGRMQSNTITGVEAGGSHIRGLGSKKDGGTVFLHLGLEDHDVWYHVRQDPSGHLSQEIWRLSNDYPNLYWLHWNPTLIDPDKGLIGPRTVPIPDFEAMTKNREEPRGLVAPPWKHRKPGVAWRGTTTGFPAGGYQNSDRFRTVKAFMNVLDADVKFGSRVQGVSEHLVPHNMMRGGMGPQDMCKYQVVLDIDGNANAWTGLRWKLKTGTTVVKVKSPAYIQWYYPYLKHGEHLWVAPVEKVVEESLALAKNGTLCDTLSKNAMEFAARHLSMEAAHDALKSALIHLHKYNHRQPWTIRNQP